MERLLFGTDWTVLTSIWVALFTQLPSLDLSTPGQEVPVNADTNYDRQELPVASGASASWVVNGLEYSNKSDIVFGAPVNTSWGQIVGAGLYDAQTGGNLLYVAALTTPKQVNVGDGNPKILAGQLRITRATC
jgi:hypothetical protein